MQRAEGSSARARGDSGSGEGRGPPARRRRRPPGIRPPQRRQPEKRREGATGPARPGTHRGPPRPPGAAVSVPERRRAHTRDNLERRSPRSAHARESPETSAPGQSFRHAGRGHRGSTNPRPAAGDRRPGACVLGTWRLRRGTGGRQARAAARCGAARGVAGDVAPGPSELKAAAPRSVFQLRSVLN